MGSGSSIAVMEEEQVRPLDASDVDTPRGESAKHEVRRLRLLLAAHAQSSTSLTPMDSGPGYEAAVQVYDQVQEDPGVAPSLQDYLVACFQAADVDGSGFLSVSEFSDFLQSRLSLGLSYEEVEAMLAQTQELYGGGDGSVSWGKFVELAPQWLKSLTHEQSADPSNTDWCCCTTPEGAQYYYNKRTQESAWALA